MQRYGMRRTNESKNEEIRQPMGDWILCDLPIKDATHQHFYMRVSVALSMRSNNSEEAIDLSCWLWLGRNGNSQGCPQIIPRFGEEDTQA
jgi:hypothetical protein